MKKKKIGKRTFKRKRRRGIQMKLIGVNRLKNRIY